MMLLLGNPAAGETFGLLPVQADRCHVLGRLGDIMKGLLRSFLLPLGKTTFANVVGRKEKLIKSV